VEEGVLEYPSPTELDARVVFPSILMSENPDVAELAIEDGVP